jgi:chitinase
MNNWNSWPANWPPAATYYLDPVAGNDAHAGTAPTTAWATYAKAEQQALSPGQSIAKKIGGAWIPFKSASVVERPNLVLGYFQQGASPIPLGSLDFGALTHVSHDHVEPNADGSLNLTYYAMTAANSTALINAAHAAGVKVLLTIADIANMNFSAAVSTSLNTFVENIVQLVISRAYDGVDIDWEHTMSTAGVLALMSALYPALKSQNPNLMVNMACAYTNEDGTVVTDRWASVKALIDTMNIMAYDLYSPGGLTTWHNAALFDANFTGYYQQAELSCLRCVKGFVSAGIPSSMLLLGIPFYGRLYAGNVGTPTSGPLMPRQNYPSAANMNSPALQYKPYNQIPPYYVAADDNWDGVAQVPYLSLLNGTASLNSFLTYDDPAAITGKVEWALSKGLAGVAIWELSLDYFSGRSIVSPLLNAVKCVSPKIALAAGSTPATVATLTAQGVSTSAVPLEWTPVLAATSYNVKRSTTSGSGYATIATVTGPGYTDATVSSGVTYYYVVSAITNGTEGSNSAQTTVVASVGSPPAAPSAFSAGTVTPTSVLNVGRSPSPGPARRRCTW